MDSVFAIATIARTEPALSEAFTPLPELAGATADVLSRYRRAFEKIADAHATIDGIKAKTHHAQTYRRAEIQRVIRAARQAVEAELANVGDAITAIKDGLIEARIPKRPAGISDQQLFDAKGDLIRLLDARSGDELLALTKLAERSKTDPLLAHLLYGGPMAMVFEAKKIDPKALEALYRHATAQTPAARAFNVAFGSDGALRAAQVAGNLAVHDELAALDVEERAALIDTSTRAA